MGYAAGFRAPGNQPEIERKRERERKKDTGTQAMMEQKCFNPQGVVGIYTDLQGILILSKDKD